jgi:hypothetical protein
VQDAAQSKVIRAREVIKDGDYSPHFSTFRREKHEIELSASLSKKAATMHLGA